MFFPLRQKQLATSHNYTTYRVDASSVSIRRILRYKLLGYLPFIVWSQFDQLSYIRNACIVLCLLRPPCMKKAMDGSMMKEKGDNLKEQLCVTQRVCDLQSSKWRASSTKPLAKIFGKEDQKRS